MPITGTKPDDRSSLSIPSLPWRAELLLLFASGALLFGSRAWPRAMAAGGAVHVVRTAASALGDELTGRAVTDGPAIAAHIHHHLV